MFELIDLKGLILSIIYEELEESVGESATKYDELKDEVESLVTQYTNYTTEMIAGEDYSEIKNQLRRPFAWILEYYSLSHLNEPTDFQQKRILRNYDDALSMLSSFPSYNEDTDSPNSYNVDMEVEKW